MTPEELIADLAFKACDDPSALPVLGDALQENDWCPDLQPVFAGITHLIYGGYWGRSEFHPPSNSECQGGFPLHDTREDRRQWLLINAATPTPTFARALAAALLCRDWQTEPWRKEFSWLALLPASGEVLDRLAGVIGLQRRQEVLAPDGLPLTEAESDQEFRTRCMAALGFHATSNERFFSRSVPDGLMD